MGRAQNAQMQCILKHDHGSSVLIMIKVLCMYVLPYHTDGVPHHTTTSTGISTYCFTSLP